MNISVSSSSQDPLYKQLYDQIAGAVLRGELKEGEPLPPIRTISQELRISVISVKRAWEELERDGFINTAVGRGCFAAWLTSEQMNIRKKKMMEEKLLPAIEYAKSLGVTKEAMAAIIEIYY